MDPQDTPPPSPPTPPREGVPEAAPAHGWFAGILEGPSPDREVVARAVAALNRIGAAELHLAHDGPRFSILADERTLRGDRLDRARLDDLFEGLAALVAASPEPGRVESTLRCTLVHPPQTTEVLFAVSGGRLRAVARSRPTRPEDERPSATGSDGDGRSWAGLSTRRRALVAGLLAAAAGLTAWRGGAFDYLLLDDPGAISIEPGPFEGLLEVRAARRWPGLAIEITRGPDYPASPADSARLEAEAASNLRLAAVRAVSSGTAVRVRALDADGAALQETTFSLRPLLERPDAIAHGAVAAHRDTRRIALAVD